ncbi:hypothetical protein DFH11DRAFT_256500 [Phellopilus nigrolimitatus]|nr:hypothetical protein DFH11DRAFT_256500 [Phellopilus nigrolimitatus]
MSDHSPEKIADTARRLLPLVNAAVEVASQPSLLPILRQLAESDTSEHPTPSSLSDRSTAPHNTFRKSLAGKKRNPNPCGLCSHFKQKCEVIPAPHVLCTNCKKNGLSVCSPKKGTWDFEVFLAQMSQQQDFGLPVASTQIASTSQYSSHQWLPQAADQHQNASPPMSMHASSPSTTSSIYSSPPETSPQGASVSPLLGYYPSSPESAFTQASGYGVSLQRPAGASTTYAGQWQFPPSNAEASTSASVTQANRHSTGDSQSTPMSGTSSNYNPWNFNL